MRHCLTSLLLLLFLLQPSSLFGWGRGHDLIRAWMLAHLPEWQKEKLDAVYWKRLGKDYNKLQDQHAGGRAPQLDKYCLPPGPRLSLHDVNPPAKSIPAMQWYLEQTIDRIQHPEKYDEEDPLDEAMKFLGVLCHWNEDPGSPSAHSSPVNEAALRILLPPAKDKVNLNYTYGYGGISSVGTFEIPDAEYKPRLLGASIPAAALRIYQHQRLLERNAAAGIIPIVQSIQYGDGTLAEKTRSRLAHRNAEHVTDICYTVFCLAFDRIDPAEARLWDEQNLSSWLSETVPRMTTHPYYVTPFLVDQSFDAQRNLHPLKIGEKEYARGFGAGVPSSIDYTLTNGGAYRKLVCEVGLHPSAGPTGSVKFQIQIDGQVVAESGFLTGKDSAVTLSAELPTDKLFQLKLVTVPGEGSESLHNLAIWGEPRLVEE
ncbi:MAG: NPCBM/NEW2 domain-containing protein [Planctomycetaceae bacterium]|nr:NPCBM/NEW2 domain-containing protein [Planctomycetaceae bacterium]